MKPGRPPKLSTFESRRFRRSIAVGVALTMLVGVGDRLGWLTALDDWFYDTRAQICQNFTKKPDDRIVHVDIDDASLDVDAVGRWPWRRTRLARIVDEIGRAKPLAIGLDIILSDRQSNEDSQVVAGTGAPEEDDAILAASLNAQKNLVLAAQLGVPSLELSSPEQDASYKELDKNLELTTTELESNLRLQGFDTGARFDIQDLFAHARLGAMRDRVSRELERASISDDELIRRLLPHTDPDIETPTLKALRRAVAAYRERRAFSSFGFQSPRLPIAPVPVRVDLIPSPSFTKKVALCGYFNFTFFDTRIVRSMPLLVQADNRLYPQFGFAFACAILGADVRNINVDADSVTISPPGGTPLRIPTHHVYSPAMKRDVALIADIPFFGGKEYLTMYDWPTHRRESNHVSVNIVWDICRTIDNIQKSNKAFDLAIQDLFSTEGNFSLDTEFATRYASALPGPDDTAAREKMSVEALAKLAADPQLANLSAINAQNRTHSQQEVLDQLLLDRKVLQIGDRNRSLSDQLNAQRKTLAGRLNGKGVLLGWTAEGLTDRANTSLHNNCPGVVIHGVIAESVLSGRWWRRAPAWIEYLFLLPLGFATSFFVARLQPLSALLATFMLMSGYLLLNGYVLFDFGKWIIPVAGPIVAISVVWSGSTLQRVIFEGIERNRVATEVAIINREMDLARKVQAALIPKTAPRITGVEADGWTLAASVAGGDCYDLWQLKDGRLAILLADASGHGLAPAMVVSQVRTLVRALSEVELHPCQLLTRVNDRVADDLEPGRFITAFLGFLGSDGLLEYASAGHGPQFWYSADGSELHLLDSTGAPLGCDSPWMCDDPGPAIQIADGGTLVVFSDGIFEAMTPTGEQFGLERLETILNGTRGQSGKRIIDQITNAMQAWQENLPPADDQTLVVARRLMLPNHDAVVRDQA